MTEATYFSFKQLAVVTTQRSLMSVPPQKNEPEVPVPPLRLTWLHNQNNYHPNINIFASQ